MLEQESREVEQGIERLLSAIEKGAPYDLCAAKLQALAGRKTDIEQRRQKLLDKEMKRQNLKASSQAIAEFSVRFRQAFDEAPHHKRKEIIQRCLKGIVVDRTAGVARCYFRPMPMLGGPVGELIEGIENAKGAPDDLPIPLRRVAVPGTGLEPARFPS